MGFLSVCTAVYDYQPQSEGELELKAGDILYILEKSTEDDWWKAKKRAVEEDEEEAEGLIPNNYVEDAQPIHSAKAMYDYTRQTEEEVSFTEHSLLEVYDNSDPDWTLVAVDGDYGFAPANYIEITEAAAPPTPARPVPASPAYDTSTRYSAPEPEQQPSPPASPIHDRNSVQARLAGVMGGIAPASPPQSRSVASPPLPTRQLTPEASEEEEAPPPKPTRPQSQTIPTPKPVPRYEQEEAPGIQPSPGFNRAVGYGSDENLGSPGGYHLYNISEMVSAMGKRKKIPITLGLNIAAGSVRIYDQKAKDGSSQEWTADRLDHYSIEGKHVFLELNKPSRSLDLHAGAKDTAKEIVSGLGEISGAHRAAGLKDIISASSGTGQKQGKILYDFMAQGDDEVTVAEGDEVLVLDDTKSEEWWNVRRIKNGKEGVVPSSYIEITAIVAAEPPSRSGMNAGRSTVEQNRLEEERLAKEAARADRARREAEESRAAALPERGSSLNDDEQRSSKRDKRSSRSEGKSRSKPDSTKVRTWTDHSGSFKVDAQFLGVADGKIHLHKSNGVKIAVPVAKMSQTDLDYVEKVTNESIEENIPVADLIKMKRRAQESSAGASIDKSQPSRPDKGPEYDWFDFFLRAGVGPHQCERYAQAMVRESMDESVVADIKIETLRSVGMKEGDALKVMKHLDQRFGRSANGVAEGGLFTGPGGALKDNTGRKRPEANRTGTDSIDSSVLQGGSTETTHQPQATATTSATATKGGFEDDAWTPKPSQTPVSAAPTSKPAASSLPAAAPLSANMQALSLLDDLKPLEPTPAPPRTEPQPQITQSPPPAVQQQQVQTGATPQMFQQVAAIQPQQSGVGPLPQINAPGRQRPQAPLSYTGSALLPPPPRPTSAPQYAQQNNFGLQPLQAQLTGVAGNAHPAPPGQSLDEMTARKMQQYLQPQPTGFMQPGMPIQNGFQPQPTGFQQLGMQQPYLNGNAAGSPFADPRGMQPQPTGFVNFQPQGGINTILPPALTPQRTGFPQQQANGFNQFQPPMQQVQPQPTGFGFQQGGFQPSIQPQPTGFGQINGFGNLPPVPPIPQSSTPAPLIPQKTGPAPEIRFGVNPAAKRLAPQPTGRRANLASASKFNHIRIRS